MLEVLDPGLLSTVQDGGRPDLAHLGVPPGGACDPWGLAAANLLAGNAPDASALEMTVAGPALAVRATCVVALGGADLGARVEEEERPLRPGTAYLLRTGTRLVFEGGSGRGARAYLALAGGIAVPRILGSASTCLAGGFGGIEGRPLRAGDRLVPERPGDLAAAGRSWPADVPLGPPHDPDLATPVHVVPGPHAGRFPPGALEALLGTGWEVDPRSDRTGLRLAGPPLPGAGGGELVSLPMTWGAVQVPPDGRPIVLLADHPTVGGYPVIAVAIRADRPLLGQLRPGDEVRFELTAIDRAQAAARAEQALLGRGVELLGPDEEVEPW